MSSFLHFDLFLATGLIPSQLLLELLILVRQDKLIRQVIFVEVIDKIPEALLASGICTQRIQIGLKFLALQHFADILEQPTRTLELRPIVSVALAAVGTTALVNLSVHLFTDCDLQRWRWDLMPTERT